MPTFRYRAADASGKASDGTLDAADERQAQSTLRSRGLFPMRIEPVAGVPASSPPAVSRVSRGSAGKDVVPFLQGLSTMLRAGIPVDRGLEMLSDLFEGRAMGGVSRSLLREVRSGSSLAEAMRRAEGSPFDRFTVQMVEAGASTGRMEEALEQAHAFLSRSKEFRSSVAGALIYPAILLCASVLSVVLLLSYVVPKFSGIFANARVELPAPTRALLSASSFLKVSWPFLAAAGAAVALLFRAALRDASARLAFDRWKISVPVLGRVVVATETSRVLRSLSSLLSGGVPILSAFVIAKEVSGNAAFREGMEAARRKVQEGVKVGVALSETTPFPRLAVQMISVGEETGKLEEMLSSVADTYERDATRVLKRLLTALEPSIILFMGLVVGFIVFALFLAIFRMNDVPM